jgi:hypothetical protein
MRDSALMRSIASLGMLVGFILAGCVPADDGFRAKLARGCTTVQACTAIHDEADARVRACINDTGNRGGACGDQVNDRMTAGDMVNRARAADGQAGRDSALAERKRVGDEQKRYRDDEKRLGSSCEDIAALEATAASIRAAPEPQCSEDWTGGPGYEQVHKCRNAKDHWRADDHVATMYTTLAQQRRQDQVRSISGSVQRITQATPSLADMVDPSAARADIAKAQSLVASLKCYNAGAFAEMQPDVDSWAAAREKAVSDEVTCRTTPACMGDRIAAPLCQAVANRQAALRDIAHERANPGGVVNLATLHDLGQTVQDNEATIADLKTKYAGVTHKPFNTATCPKTP